MNAANAPIPSQLENERRAHEPSMEEILASIRKIIADDDALPLSRSSAPPRLFETNVTPFAPAAPAARPEPARAPEPQQAEPASVAAAETRLDATEMESFAEVGRELARLDAPGKVDGAAEQGEDLRPSLDVAPGVDLAPVVDLAPLAEPAPVAGLADETDDAEANPVPHEEPLEASTDSEPLFAPAPPRFFEARDERGMPPAPAVETSRPGDGGAMLSAEANASVASAFQALSASVQMASAESIDRHVREMLRPMLKQWLDDNLPVMVERMVRAEIERVARGGR